TGVKPSLGTATFGTDCSVLQPEAGIKNVICGPGSIKMAHQPDEHVDVNQLLDSIDVYSMIAKRFAGQ
ncbi:MAG: M20/M25/M40 family metallo-hydrolase, partial [Candidatus Hermodarchaeota archaeon]